jgi:hypothetical protein
MIFTLLNSNIIIIIIVSCHLTIVVRSSKLTPCVFEYNSSLISQGEVYTPNYPKEYPNNLNCRYEFYARENERVIIKVLDFMLEAPQVTSGQDIDFMDHIETRSKNKFLFLFNK